MGTEDSSQPAATESNTRCAYWHVRDAIVEGRYAPGSRLVEQRIATELNLSRTPVREALKMLDAEGLVSIERNVGALVRALDRDTIVDVYELRSRLESYGAMRAALNRTADDMTALAGAVDAFDRAVETVSDDPDHRQREINRCNSAFHDAVIRAADNNRLTRMLGHTLDVPLVFQAFRHFDLERFRQSALFHRLVAEAIAAQRPDRAERLMAEHIDQGRDVLLAAVGDQQLTALLFGQHPTDRMQSDGSR